MNTPSNPAQTFKAKGPSLYRAGFSGAQTGPAGAGAGNDLAMTVQNCSAGLANADSSIVDHPLYSMVPPAGYPAGAATTGYAAYTPAAYSHGAPVMMVDARKECAEVRDCMNRFIRMLDARDAQHEQDEARFKELEGNFQTRIAELEEKSSQSELAARKAVADKKRVEAENARLKSENAEVKAALRKYRELESSVSAAMKRMRAGLEGLKFNKEGLEKCLKAFDDAKFPEFSDPDDEFDPFAQEESV